MAVRDALEPSWAVHALVVSDAETVVHDARQGVHLVVEGLCVGFGH